MLIDTVLAFIYWKKKQQQHETKRVSYGITHRHIQWNQVWFCRLCAFASFTAFMRLNDEKSAHYVNLSIGKLVFSNQLIFSAHILAVFFPFFSLNPIPWSRDCMIFPTFASKKWAELTYSIDFNQAACMTRDQNGGAKKANTKQKQKRCHLVSWCTLFVIKPFFCMVSHPFQCTGSFKMQKMWYFTMFMLDLNDRFLNDC